MKLHVVLCEAVRKQVEFSRSVSGINFEFCIFLSTLTQIIDIPLVSVSLNQQTLFPLLKVSENSHINFYYLSDLPYYKSNPYHRKLQSQHNRDILSMQPPAQQIPRPPYGKILAFDHITFWVGNAKQTASFYTSRFGFDYFAYKGLETGERGVASHAVRNAEGSIFVFCSVYQQDSNDEMNRHLVKHGDGVRDIAFTVENSKAIYDFAIKGGAISVHAPTQLKDENGSVIISSVRTYGQTTHTFVERKNYKGLFLPGFVPHYNKETFNDILKPIRFERVDHIVGNQQDLQMEPVVNWYEKCLGFHRFWSVDDKMMHTEYSALRSVVVADYDENVKMPINEPAAGKKKSQIQEYVDYYHDAGVQHIALKTETIVETVENLKSRGIQFLSIPDTYYDILRKNLPDMNIKVSEDIDHLQKNKILIDYDDKGYLLQIFTKPVEDRPTLFYEIIQRRNHSGFGAGNFKSLFVSIEEEQNKRGNLTDL